VSRNTIKITGTSQHRDDNNYKAVPHSEWCQQSSQKAYQSFHASVRNRW